MTPGSHATFFFSAASSKKTAGDVDGSVSSASLFSQLLLGIDLFRGLQSVLALSI